MGPFRPVLEQDREERVPLLHQAAQVGWVDVIERLTSVRPFPMVLSFATVEYCGFSKIGFRYILVSVKRSVLIPIPR
jgi:hypothetical protein